MCRDRPKIYDSQRRLRSDRKGLLRLASRWDEETNWISRLWLCIAEEFFPNDSFKQDLFLWFRPRSRLIAFRWFSQSNEFGWRDGSPVYDQLLNPASCCDRSVKLPFHQMLDSHFRIAYLLLGFLEPPMLPRGNGANTWGQSHVNLLILTVKPLIQHGSRVDGLGLNSRRNPVTINPYFNNRCNRTIIFWLNNQNHDVLSSSPWVWEHYHSKIPPEMSPDPRQRGTRQRSRNHKWVTSAPAVMAPVMAIFTSFC
jgi:hypothetical protein